jgi:hypothetical protein
MTVFIPSCAAMYSGGTLARPSSTLTLPLLTRTRITSTKPGMRGRVRVAVGRWTCVGGAGEGGREEVGVGDDYMKYAGTLLAAHTLHTWRTDTISFYSEPCCAAI